MRAFSCCRRFAVRLLGHLKRLRCIREQLITPVVIVGLAERIVLTNRSHRLAFETLEHVSDFGLGIPLPFGSWLLPPWWISHSLLSDGCCLRKEQYTRACRCAFLVFLKVIASTLYTSQYTSQVSTRYCIHSKLKLINHVSFGIYFAQFLRS